MKLVSLTLAAILGTALVLPAMAQTKVTPDDDEVGYEYGYNPPPGQYRFNKSNTVGWNMMSPDEKMAYHTKMWNTKSLEECKAVQSQNQAMMEKRAKEMNVKANMAKRNACEIMAKKGKFK